MRDKLKNEQHFNRWIEDFYQSLERVSNWIQSGKTPHDRVNIMQRSMARNCISIIQCKYSSNNPISSLKDDLLKSIDLTYESWDGFWLIEHRGGKLKQYSLNGYDEMIWMLSLGYLLKIDGVHRRKLVEVIDRDGVQDYLLEFIIRASSKDRKPIAEESYQEFFGVPHTFEKLRNAITETDKIKAENLVRDFITKDWYKNHKDSSWHNSHASKSNTYFGYWSFETAAVVAILDLDDSSFRDCPYYPKDLVDYYRQNK